jgi:archaellum component FlaC
MKEDNLKLAQKGIDDALNTIEALEKNIKDISGSNDMLKESFYILSKKVDEIENILKSEGIL